MEKDLTSVCLSFDFDAFSIWISTFRQTTATPFSRGEYSGRVGIVRVLDLLARQGIPATFFVPAHTASSFPDAIVRMAREGHEIASHGFLHETPDGLSMAEEEDLLARSREVLERISGSKPVGYRSPAWDLSENSLTLLEKYGYSYDSSLMSDDFTPFVARQGDKITDDGFTPGPETGIVEFPVAWELDDYPYFHFSPKPNNQGLRPVSDVFDAWFGEFDYCDRHVADGVFTLTCHPEIIGRGPRILMLERLVEHIRARGATFTTLASEALRRRPGARAAA